LFNYWIDDFSNIYSDESVGLHPILERDLYKLYFDSTEDDYSGFFLKLDRNEKLNELNKNDKTRTVQN
jgi:hypothetical protein